MTLMQVARKAKIEHEQEKHNTSYASKLGVVSKLSSDQARNDNQETKGPTQELWLKWVKMQQQLMVAVKEAQSIPKNSNRSSTGVRGGKVRAPVPVGKGPIAQWQGNTQNSETSRNKHRPEGEMIRPRFNALIVKGWYICIVSA